MTVTIERWTGSAWTDITATVPLRGYPQLGLQAMTCQKQSANRVTLARFSVEGDDAWDTDCGDEIRISGALNTFFGGYVARRKMKRRGTMLGANYELVDYTSLLDRIVVPDYTVDAGDTDSTEVTALVNTYLVPLGVTVGQIDTIQASLEEIFLQGTFRQAMEAIAAQAAGAYFYIDAYKQFHYFEAPADLSAPSWTGLDLSDDPTDHLLYSASPYAELEYIEDNTRRVDRVYIVGDGVEGWYGPVYGTYQAIVWDETVTSSAALTALGQAITAWQNPMTSYTLVTNRENPFHAPGVRLKHSEFTSGYEDLFVNRAELWALSDGTNPAVACRIELGDHRLTDGSFSGGGPAGSTSGRGPIFGDGSEHTDIEPDDTSTAGVSRYAAREDHQHGFETVAPSNIGTANAEGSADSMVRSDHVHNHPSGLGADLHHNQSHVLATTAGLGADHTTSGLTSGQVLRATGATSAAFQSIQAADLPALGGTPGLTLSTANAAGSASTYVRTDATIAVFDATAPDTLTPDQAGAAGSASVAARRDHAHAITCAAPTGTLTESSTNTEGTASTFARSDHTHAISVAASGAPSDAQYLTLAYDGDLSAERLFTAGNGLDDTDGGANGAYTLFLGTPGTLSVTSSNGVTATSHTHTVTSSSNPGSAASLLATDSNGQVRVMRLGIGGASTASDNSIKFADDGWVGLAYNGGRFVFDSTPSPDNIRVDDANLDLDGNALVLDPDGDTTLYATEDTAIFSVAGNDQYEFTAAKLTIKAAGGGTSLEVFTHGDVDSTGPDFKATSQLGLAGDNVWVFIDPDSGSSSGHFSIINNVSTSGGVTTPLFRVLEAGQVAINTSAASTKQGKGLTIHQGSETDIILALQGTGVNHGFTTLADNDTFGHFQRASSTRGGLRVRGWRENSSTSTPYGALELGGYLDENANTTKTSGGGYGIIRLIGGIESGGGVTAANSDANIVSIESHGSVRYIFDAEGSAHSDVEWTTFDAHDDVGLLGLLESSFGKFADEHRAQLEGLGIATYDGQAGHAMVNWTKLTMLLVGSARQTGARLAAIERYLGPGLALGQLTEGAN